MIESPRPPRRALIVIAALVVIVALIAAFIVNRLSVAARRATPTPFMLVITATPRLPGETPAPPPGTEPFSPVPPISPTPTYRQFFPGLRVPLRHIGYGISVAPHQPARPDLLDEMGMDWVKVYDTPQIADYPGRNVLFRVNTDPANPDGWERGLYDLAPELASRGAVAVEIGNEANLAGEWNGRPNPAEFADALCRAYRAFKRTVPQITVVAGGLAPADNIPGQAINDLDFARQVLDAGASNCFDAWGYHPYGFDQPPEADPFEHEMTFRRAERMYQVLAERGLGDRPIWITEFGWIRDPTEEGVDCSADPNFVNFEWMVVSRDTQAVYTARAVTYAAENWPWVGPMFLWNLDWNLYDQSYEPPCSHLRWYGILDTNGTPLPVFHAMRQIRSVPAE